jgi:hypothetical protein
MNWTTFMAMLARDAHVARRNLVGLALQTTLQPLLFVFVFGKVMTTGRMIPASYQGLLAPGLMGMSMLLTGLQAVAMPLIGEFLFTREIEDRLLAPMTIGWLAVEKLVAGVIQALIAGTAVVLSARLILGEGVGLSLGRPVLLAGGRDAGGGIFGGRGAGAGLHGRNDADRTDVQHGAFADDFLRLRVLSVERAEQLPAAAEAGAAESPGVRERGPARHTCAAVSAFAG